MNSHQQSTSVKIFSPKRLLILTITAVLLYTSLLASAVTNNFSQPFKDVNADSWYVSPITRLYKIGGIQGYSDGTIRPNNTITRAEFIALLLATNGHKQKSSDAHWFGNYYIKSIEMGLIPPTDNYKFNENIHRDEMVEILCKFLKLPTKAISPSPFLDPPVNPVYADTAYANNLVKGYPNGTLRYFRPTYTLTRAEASTIVINAYDYLADPKGFVAGISASSQAFEKKQMFSFNTNVIHKNSSLYNIEALGARSSEQAFRITLYLAEDKEAVKRQITEVSEILKQQFDEQSTQAAIAYISSKNDRNVELPLKEFTSSSGKYKVSVQSGGISYFTLITIWRAES